MSHHLDSLIPTLINFTQGAQEPCFVGTYLGFLLPVKISCDVTANKDCLNNSTDVMVRCPGSEYIH